MSRETGVLRRGRIFRGIYGQIKRVMKRVGQRDFRDSLWEAEVSSRFLVKREEGCRKKKQKQIKTLSSIYLPIRNTSILNTKCPGVSSSGGSWILRHI